MQEKETAFLHEKIHQKRRQTLLSAKLADKVCKCKRNFLHYSILCLVFFPSGRKGASSPSMIYIASDFMHPGCFSLPPFLYPVF
jgi:hypothetical protein